MTENELTQLHGRVLEVLDLAGIAHEDEYAITVKGQDYQLDCLLPDYYACVEVDGTSHGMRGRKDRARDESLLGAGIPTLRLSQRLVDSETTEGLMRFILSWLAIIEENTAERRKRSTKDALWD
ncbi:hypothetical protein LCGC14_2243930 [marine sediment metagenome]|uniref:DUF559 domain-containing protein n=1 Tax=marine sediment metagenome TaxID=412755 RepID=A0A0F9FZK2_9ZZZZ